MKRTLIILMLLLGFGVCNVSYAQTGGKKREKYSRKGKKRGNFHLTQYKSRGHADEFARGAGRKGFIARIFRKADRPAWSYKSSGSRRSHYKDNQFLFTRARSKGRLDNDQISGRQNAERARSRQHGNKSFRFRKYKAR